MRYLLALSILVGGCGKDLSRFVGTWNATTTTTGNCPVGSSTQTHTGNTEIRVGTTSDLVTLDACSCNAQWTATSSTQATLNMGQTCASCNGGTDLKFTTGNMTSDGTTLNYSYAGSATYLGMACTFTATGMATKVSQ